MLPQVIDDVVHADAGRSRVADLDEDRLSAGIIRPDDNALLKDQSVTGGSVRVGRKIVESVGEACSTSGRGGSRGLVADNHGAADC